MADANRPLLLAGNDGTPIPNRRIAWRITYLKVAALTVVLTIWNLVSRRKVTSAQSDVDVSLTTYGRRATSAFATIESIGLGSLRPRRLILWIDEPELVAHPPATLRRLVKRGLEIIPCEANGPHSKYFPYCQRFSDDRKLLATADDDMLYPRWWLRALVEAYTREPGHVVAHRAWAVLQDENGYSPYAKWALCSSSEARFDLFATGVSGVLYDHKMVELLRRAGTGFRSACPRADDVWLHFVALASGVKVRQVRRQASEFWPRLRTSINGLARENTTGGGNDIALASTARLFRQNAE
ncbi:hypothetical protein [Mycolicibacterium iranicum]|uniref:Glycosyltransferase n=1 Tax=Mycolicibacterium iranicum TaxID=912594 RepID=A0ABT4HFL8_MYCIR|nr:hypothetical protein [Mycolicibacterium iranicum]MCZ0728998.1 hypothetical protein [Mycolicibacterium iranicum]